MKKTTGTILGCIALLSFSVYVLACTSFSPDDSRVLYPAFDTASGRIGIAVYDRNDLRSEMLLVPVGPEDTLVRASWLADGRQALVFWGAGGTRSLRMALVAATSRGPTRIFEVPDFTGDAGPFAYGIGLLGKQVYLGSDTNQVTRFDLKTGLSETREIPGVKTGLVPLPSAEGNRLFYLTALEDPTNTLVFGRMHPETLALTPVLTVTNRMRDESFFAYDKNGTAIAYIETVEETDRLVVARENQPVFLRPLGSPGQKVSFGSAGFFRKGQAVWATFVQRGEGEKPGRCGFLEIPLSKEPIRQTILLTNVPATDEDRFYFQGSVSHDGKTAAVASTYLVRAKMAPANCALFFIDLSDRKRTVTRVPIPVPATSTRPR